MFLSTLRAYSSFPCLKNLELILFINKLLLHGLNPVPLVYIISAKNHLNCLQNLLFESLFVWVSVDILVVAILLISGFYLTANNYVSDHSNFPNIMSPVITEKTSEVWRARFLDMFIFSLPELRYSLLEFNSRNICQQVWSSANSLFKWCFRRRWRPCCLISLLSLKRTPLSNGYVLLSPR